MVAQIDEVVDRMNRGKAIYAEEHRVVELEELMQDQSVLIRRSYRRCIDFRFSRRMPTANAEDARQSEGT